MFKLLPNRFIQLKTMSEAKENLERLRARRAGHRDLEVCTKLQKVADELVLQAFDENGDINC